MPYRRLPKTDVTRLSALRELIKETDKTSFNEQFVSFAAINKAKNILSLFERNLIQFQETIKSEEAACKRYRLLMGHAKMYVSHFIQVLNLAVIRGDVKKEHKNFYQLNPDANTTPDLNADEALLTWGKNVIEGEKERTRNGGAAIYNPAIGKVKVHYDLFKDYQITYNLHKSTTRRNRETIEKLRLEVDEIILDIWNQVEEHFADCAPYEKLKNCENYGLIYYYRRNEPRLTPESDIAIAQPHFMDVTSS